MLPQPDTVYLSSDWAKPGRLSPQQRALVLLHELRHSLDGAGEATAYRAMYVAETRYRAKMNGLPLPVPPLEPTTIIFSEKGYQTAVEHLPLAERIAIVQEINATGAIADDTWP